MEASLYLVAGSVCPGKPFCTFAFCPHCRAVDIVVSHAWLCPKRSVQVPNSTRVSPRRTATLFDKGGSSQDVASKVTFVEACVHDILVRVHWHRPLDAADDEEARADQWSQGLHCQPHRVCPEGSAQLACPCAQ